MDALGVLLAGEQLLRQRRARVRQVRLLADHHQLAVEPCFARRLSRPQPGKRGADDDEAGYAHCVPPSCQTEVSSVLYGRCWLLSNCYDRQRSAPCRDHRRRTQRVLRRRPAAGRRRAAVRGRSVRPAADAVRARPVGRGAGPSEDQVGHPGLRQDFPARAVPLLRPRRAGQRHRSRATCSSTTTSSVHDRDLDR